MFEPPSNLPVEPTPATKTAQPKPEKGVGMGFSSGKEPEDIFADMDNAGNETTAGVPKQMAQFEAPRRSPVKVVLAILVPLGVLALGVGGYYLYSSYTEANPSVLSKATSTQPETVIPASNETGDRVPLTNPVPPPDESALAASKASMTLLQAEAEQASNTMAAITASTTVQDLTVTETVNGTTETPVIEGANLTEQQNTDNQAEASNIPPPVTPQVAADNDKDGLTDAEEVLFGTNPAVVDSDGDGYSDGSEVQNGYDPAVPKNSLLSSAALKAEKIGSLNMLVPTTWSRSAGAGGTVVIKSGTPASFNISLDAYTSMLPLKEFLTSKYPGSTADDYVQGQNVNGLDVVYSKDRLSTWIVAGNTLYTLRYATNGNSIDYPMIFEMMSKFASTNL